MERSLWQAGSETAPVKPMAPSWWEVSCGCTHPTWATAGAGVLRQASRYLVPRQHPEQRPACAQGSATVCILVLEGARLHAANLGDSGFWVLRGRKVVHRSPQQQHAFNWPFQLGSPGSRSDTPSSADVRCQACFLQGFSLSVP